VFLDVAGLARRHADLEDAYHQAVIGGAGWAEIEMRVDEIRDVRDRLLGLKPETVEDLHWLLALALTWAEGDPDIYAEDLAQLLQSVRDGVERIEGAAMM
jgi:hypothetical protein